MFNATWINNNSEKISLEIEKQIIKHGLEEFSWAYTIGTFAWFFRSLLKSKEALFDFIVLSALKFSSFISPINGMARQTYKNGWQESLREEKEAG